MRGGETLHHQECLYGIKRERGIGIEAEKIPDYIMDSTEGFHAEPA